MRFVEIEQNFIMIELRKTKFTESENLFDCDSQRSRQ